MAKQGCLKSCYCGIGMFTSGSGLPPGSHRPQVKPLHDGVADPAWEQEAGQGEPLSPHQPYYSHWTHHAGPFRIMKENSALPGPKKMRPPLLGMPCTGQRLTAGSCGQRRLMVDKIRLEMIFWWQRAISHWNILAGGMGESLLCIALGCLLSPEEEVEVMGWGSRAIRGQRVGCFELITADPSAPNTCGSPLQRVSCRGLGESPVQIGVCKG